jgi:NADP-dependent 3-hydroxy acid dehydrogenase YdfG
MASPTYTSALIVGAGQGLSASLTRLLRKEGLAVAIAARDTAKLAPLCTETGARSFACDAQDEAQVQRLFELRPWVERF